MSQQILAMIKKSTGCIQHLNHDTTTASVVSHVLCMLINHFRCDARALVRVHYVRRASRRSLPFICCFRAQVRRKGSASSNASSSTDGSSIADVPDADVVASQTPNGSTMSDSNNNYNSSSKSSSTGSCCIESIASSNGSNGNGHSDITNGSNANVNGNDNGMIADATMEVPAIISSASVISDNGTVLLGDSNDAGDELTTTKDNLKSFIERWEEHPNSPYVFDTNAQSIAPVCTTLDVADLVSNDSLAPASVESSTCTNGSFSGELTDNGDVSSQGALKLLSRRR